MAIMQSTVQIFSHIIRMRLKLSREKKGGHRLVHNDFIWLDPFFEETGSQLSRISLQFHGDQISNSLQCVTRDLLSEKEYLQIYLIIT